MDAEELLKRILELEEGQAEFKRDVSELLPTTGHQRHGDSSSRAGVPSNHLRRRRVRHTRSSLGGRCPTSSSCGRRSARLARGGSTLAPHGGASRRPLAAPGCLPGTHHVMAMQSLGQAVHILDLRGEVLYWYDSPLIQLSKCCFGMLNFFFKMLHCGAGCNSTQVAGSTNRQSDRHRHKI